VIEYRAFRNSDPPALVDVWRSLGRMRGLVQPMSLSLLEQSVLAKPYFDRQGLVLAWEDGRPLGFVHAGFGPNEAQTDLDTSTGITCLLAVKPHGEEAAIRTELLARSESYLRARGARVLLGGAVRPLSPFYLGLYGGSEMPGVLVSEQVTQDLYRSQGYSEQNRTLILHRDLAEFRPTFDRRQIQYRRRMTVDVEHNPRAHTWWEACTLGGFDRLRFRLRSGTVGSPVAVATFCAMESFSAYWGMLSCGLVELRVEPDSRRQGYARYLLGEAFRELQCQGVALVETQTMATNEPAAALYCSLGFTEVDQGVVFRKEA